MKKWFHREYLKSAVIGLIMLSSLLSCPAWADILIISNKNVSETTLSKNYVQGIFLGKRGQWQDIGFQIINVTRPEGGGCIVIRRRPITQ